MMVADLQRALAHVGHVAVRTGHPGAGVDALVPHLELGVLAPSALAPVSAWVQSVKPARGNTPQIWSTVRPLAQGYVRRFSGPLKSYSTWHWPQTKVRISCREAIAFTS